MEMIRSFYFLILISFPAFATERYIKIIENEMCSFAKKYQKQGYFLKGEGGAMMDDIQEVFMSFDVKCKPSISEARARYVSITREFIKKINENKGLRPYLHDYPMSLKNLDFMVDFVDEYNDFWSDGTVTLVYNCGNNIHYRGYDKKNDKLYPIHSESYEEALELVNLERCLKNTLLP